MPRPSLYSPLFYLLHSSSHFATQLVVPLVTLYLPHCSSPHLSHFVTSLFAAFVTLCHTVIICYTCHTSSRTALPYVLAICHHCVDVAIVAWRMQSHLPKSNQYLFPEFFHSFPFVSHRSATCASVPACSTCTSRTPGSCSHT